MKLSRRNEVAAGQFFWACRSALKGRTEARTLGQADLRRYQAGLTDRRGCGCRSALGRSHARSDRCRRKTLARVEEAGPLQASTQRKERVLRRRSAIGGLGVAAEARQVEACRQRRSGGGRPGIGPGHCRSNHGSRHHRSRSQRRRHHLAGRGLIHDFSGLPCCATAAGCGVDASAQQEKGGARCACDGQHIAVVISRDRGRDLRSRCCGSSRGCITRRDTIGRRRSGKIRRNATICRTRLHICGGRASCRSARCDAARRRSFGDRTRGRRRRRVDHCGRGGKGDDRRAGGGRSRRYGGLHGNRCCSRRGRGIARRLLEHRGSFIDGRCTGFCCARSCCSVRRYGRRRYIERRRFLRKGRGCGQGQNCGNRSQAGANGVYCVPHDQTNGPEFKTGSSLATK